jgi:acyl-CoA thioester hydrolase
MILPRPVLAVRTRRIIHRTATQPMMHDRVASIEFRVRYAETDQMGVVYHANYLVWCELGRTELIRQRGTPYAELERQGVVLAVADASVRYHAAARYDDLIRVEAWIDQLRSRTITFAYRVLRVDDGEAVEKLATASTTLICLDRSSRPMKVPADLIRRLQDA